MFYAARQAAAICAARSDVRSSEVNALMEWLNVDPVNMMMYTSATGPPGAAGKWTTGVVGAVIESAKIDLSIKLFLEVDIHIPIGDDGYINLSGGPNTALKLEIDPRQAIRDVLTTLKEVLIPEVTKAGEQVDQAEKGVSEGGAEGGSGRGSEGDGDSGSGSAGGGGDDSSEPEPSEPEPSEPEPPTVCPFSFMRLLDSSPVLISRMIHQHPLLKALNVPNWMRTKEPLFNPVLRRRRKW